MNAAIRTLGCCLTPMALLWSAAVCAQEKPADYPLRPLRIIIAVAPGGGADYVARATAQMLSDRWGQNAVVDSRPGGAGVVAVELLARAIPDGPGCPRISALSACLCQCKPASRRRFRS